MPKIKDIPLNGFFVRTNGLWYKRVGSRKQALVRDSRTGQHKYSIVIGNFEDIPDLEEEVEVALTEAVTAVS